MLSEKIGVGVCLRWGRGDEAGKERMLWKQRTIETS